jgi:two-component system NtrC family response regulator
MARVLLIAADAPTRQMIAEALQGAGHTVSVTDNVKEGLASLGRGGIEVVLADLPRPEPEVMQAIVELRAQSSLVKILLIARNKQPMDFLSLRMMGANDVLRYPLPAEDLLHAVRQALREEDEP